MSHLGFGAWESIATIVGAILALVALIMGVIEYAHQGAQKRAEHFITMRKRLKESVFYEEICALIEIDDEGLRGTPFKDKRTFLGLFEEVAIMMNSGLIRKQVAHYMFGYYAIRCWESANFWHGVNRDSFYWSVFRDFAAQMKELERGYSFKRRNYRF